MNHQQTTPNLASTPQTFPQLLLARASQYGERKVALREKEFGIWQATTWAQYARHVKYFCLGLLSLGMQPRDVVAIVGDNRPEWLFAELAAQAVGGFSIGIYQDAIVEEMAYVIAFAETRFVVVEDQE